MGDDYANWSLMMEMYLESKGLLDAITRPVHEPTEAEMAQLIDVKTESTLRQVLNIRNEDYKKWRVSSQKAFVELKRYTSTSFRNIYGASAAKYWAKLKEVYGQPTMMGAFTKYKALKKWQLNWSANPSLSINELQEGYSKLKDWKMEVPESLQVFEALSQLPTSLNHFTSHFLQTGKKEDLTFAKLTPDLQREWDLQQSRSSGGLLLARIQAGRISKGRGRGNKPYNPSDHQQNRQPNAQAGPSRKPAPKVNRPPPNWKPDVAPPPNAGPNWRQHQWNNKWKKQAAAAKKLQTAGTQDNKGKR